MATILKNIVQFVGLVVGVPTALPHLLNVNGIPAVPKIGGVSASGFTVTADAIDVTVTRTADGGADVDVYVEYWHTVEAVVPPGGLAGLTPLFFANGGASGGTVGPGTPGKLAKFTGANAVGDSQINDDGATINATAATNLFLFGGAAGPSMPGLVCLSTGFLSLSGGAGGQEVQIQNTGGGDITITGTGGASKVKLQGAAGGVVLNGGGGGVRIAETAGEGVGFYATAPIARQADPGAGATAAQLRTILLNLGLIG